MAFSTLNIEEKAQSHSQNSKSSSKIKNRKNLASMPSLNGITSEYSMAVEIIVTRKKKWRSFLF